MMPLTLMLCACGHIGANIASLLHKLAQHHFEQSEILFCGQFFILYCKISFDVLYFIHYNRKNKEESV